jgi:hypothetical protein
MIRILSILAVILIGCASPGIDDVNKRNEKWAWWIDQSSGIGSWILIGDEKTFKSGHYTLFYRNGHIYQRIQLSCMILPENPPGLTSTLATVLLRDTFTMMVLL